MFARTQAVHHEKISMTDHDEVGVAFGKVTLLFLWPTNDDSTKHKLLTIAGLLDEQTGQQAANAAKTEQNDVAGLPKSHKSQ